jgi:hypothetical protein
VATIQPTNATPVPEPEAEHGPEMLFVQTYQSGTITPVDGTDGRYTLALEAGTGQTVYFSDRPDRIVGATETPQFLESLGFSQENPPNAALVVETAPGESDVAVVELFDPSYDPISQSVSYEIQVLANWQNELELGFTEAPTDLATLAPSFGAAQLFIDDCPDGVLICYHPSVSWDEWRKDPRLRAPSEIVGRISNSDHDGFCYSWYWGGCLPCQPWYSDGNDAFYWWAAECQRRFPDKCQNVCEVWGL